MGAVLTLGGITPMIIESPSLEVLYVSTMGDRESELRLGLVPLVTPTRVSDRISTTLPHPYALLTLHPHLTVWMSLDSTLDIAHASLDRPRSP